ncbi:DRP3A [Symbiodinium pilosum]|uniref:DRP3A protein n=1 Tax=Symbiodinium pilosum TaxID=2952 RepID=A0A812VNU8_SYMPI|nr:DRP3A [Symbiodinium pilosum]
MSDILSKTFRGLDQLRPLLLEVLDHYRPLAVVVIGDESAGKSTLLEMLIGKPILARKRRFCTKLEIRVCLRRNPDVCKTTLLVYTVRDGKEVPDGEPREVPQENGYDWVQEEMDRLASELSDSQAGGIVTEKIIVIEVHGPEVPSIDLIDNPGLTSVPKEKEEAVLQIVQKQVDDDQRNGRNNMYLAIVPAAGDVKPNTNNAMKFIMKNNLQDRTVGVFSKCDQTNKAGGSEILRALALNEPTKQGESPEMLGRVDVSTWTASMLQQPEEGTYSNNFERLEVQGQNETKFFLEGDENFRCLYERGVAGMRAIVHNIERSYLIHLHETWMPQTMRKLLLKEKEVEFRICMTGLVQDEAERSTLARKEVEFRLGKSSGVTQRVYHQFIRNTLRGYLAVKVNERLSRYQGAGFVCEGWKQMQEMRSLQADLFAIIKSAIQQMKEGLVVPLESWLQAESKVVKMPDGDRVNLRTEGGDGSFLDRFDGGKPKKELVAFLQATGILQLSNHSSYTDKIVAACVNLIENAGAKIQKQCEDLLSWLLDLESGSSSWGGIQVHPHLLDSTADEEVSKVSLSLESGRFLDNLLALFLREVPAPDALQKLHEGIEVGKERPEAEQELRSLEDELRKLEVAKRGIISALRIKDEEYEQMRLALEAEDSSADCCLVREGTEALSWPASTSSASSAESRSVQAEEHDSTPRSTPAEAAGEELPVPEPLRELSSLAEVPAPEVIAAAEVDEVEGGSVHSFQPGDRVKFLQSDPQVSNWSGVPTPTLEFLAGQVTTIHRISESKKGFTTRNFPTLWAPLSAVEAVEGEEPEVEGSGDAAVEVPATSSEDAAHELEAEVPRPTSEDAADKPSAEVPVTTSKDAAAEFAAEALVTNKDDAADKLSAEMPATPNGDSAGELAAEVPATPATASGAANQARHPPGTQLRALRDARMRESEDLGSECKGRVKAGSEVEVVQEGSGRRVKVRQTHEDGSAEGWVSVCTRDDAPLFEAVETSKEPLPSTAPAATPGAPSPAEPAEVENPQPEDFMEGQEVVVDGLKNNTELNGQLGILKEKAMTEGCWNVEVGEKIYKVKIQNLRVAGDRLGSVPDW